MRYCSPVCDLVYYIFCCTTKELRDKHYEDFLNVYHSTLTEFLKRLGSDPEKLFPREAFDDHLKRFGRFGLTMAAMVLPIFVSEVEGKFEKWQNQQILMIKIQQTFPTWTRWQRKLKKPS